MPSQRGDLPDCLQPQKYTVPVAVAVYFSGTNGPPLWLPSQNGFFWL